MTPAVGAPRTRRQLVSSAVIAAAGASGLIGADAAGAAAAQASDASALRQALGVEQLVLVAYRKAISSGALEPAIAHTAEQFLGQELEHVAILKRTLVDLGASSPPAPRDLAAAQRALAAHHVTISLTDLRTQRDCLRLLVDVETLAEDAYFKAIGKLTDPALLRTSAEIMGCEAQHWTLLSSASHHGNVKIAVPYPFVGGTT